MKLQSLLLSLALLPVALFAGNPNSGGTTSTPTGPTVIPGGAFTTPYVISAPGSYVLGGSRTVTAQVNVIEITAPDVTLDLGGFSLSQTGNFNNVAGVYVTPSDNVEIRNGSIVNVSSYGVYAANGSGVRVFNVRVVGPCVIGIVLNVTGGHIDHCYVTDCSFSGISADGGGTLVTDCTAVGVNSVGTGIGVQNGARVIRSVARGGKWGFYVGAGATAVDCTASGSASGFVMNGGTLRSVDVFNNTLGVDTQSPVNVIKDSRIAFNTTAINGVYTNGGGNILQ